MRQKAFTPRTLLRRLPARFAALGLATLALLVAGGIAFAAPPSNDNLAAATVISGATGTISGTNVEATGETGEGAHGSGGPNRSVWYTWTAPSSGSVTFETCASA